jgi:hypothetical protein
VGRAGYDKGAKLRSDFFKREIVKFDVPELSPIGKKIIDCCLEDAPLSEYIKIVPMRY